MPPAGLKPQGQPLHWLRAESVAPKVWQALHLLTCFNMTFTVAHSAFDGVVLRETNDTRACLAGGADSFIKVSLSHPTPLALDTVSCLIGPSSDGAILQSVTASWDESTQVAVCQIPAASSELISAPLRLIIPGNEESSILSTVFYTECSLGMFTKPIVSGS